MTPQQIEAMKLALEALKKCHYYMIDAGLPNQSLLNEAFTAYKALEKALAQPEQEPVAIDQATMELAESVGLIGPTSRTHDLHQAIQRFHDLICVNATVKAAQMAADVIRESTPPQPERHELQAKGEHPAPCARFCEANAFQIVIKNLKAQLAQRKPLTDEEIVKITSDPCLYIRGGDYRIDIARAIEAAHGIKENT